jgi:iron(III) transport system substrate-binding protein
LGIIPYTPLVPSTTGVRKTISKIHTFTYDQIRASGPWSESAVGIRDCPRSAVPAAAPAEILGTAMKDGQFSKRDVLAMTTTLAAGAMLAPSLNAAALEPGLPTPALIQAARKEGKIAFYTGLDLTVAEKLSRMFEARYPGIAVRVERSGSERLFQRIGQEQASHINAVDVACSTDVAHFLFWKRNDLLAPFVPEDVAKYFPSEHVDADGMYATVCAWLIVIGYNTDLVKPQDAPKSLADLLNPKWMGKMVKAHPSYSGAILTSTFEIVRELGWEYLERLAKQRVMQVQSSVDPPKKIALGERALMADGNDYNLIQFKDQGQPVEVVYATEGAQPIIVSSGIFRSAPNPNAARLFQSFLFGVESQQVMVDPFAHRSFHALVREKPGRPLLSEIKLMKADPAGVEAQSDEIKTRYAKIFGV